MYPAMMDFYEPHVEMRGEIQNLLWGLRHAATPTRRYKNSMPIKFRFSTNESMPDGASLYSELRSQVARISKDFGGKETTVQDSSCQCTRQARGITAGHKCERLFNWRFKCIISGTYPHARRAHAAGQQRHSLLMAGASAKTIANALKNPSEQLKKRLANVFHCWDQPAHITQALNEF